MSGSCRPIKPAVGLKKMENVGQVRHVNPFSTFKTAEAVAPVPEHLYEEAFDGNMNHRQSLPVVPSLFEVDCANQTRRRSEGLRRSPIPFTHVQDSGESKRRAKFRSPVGDSLVSGTSLIMASSSTLNAATYVEKKFLNGSSSLEDMWVRSQDYPFENLVFEGGGSKGMAYVGALQVLEDMDILKNIKRFAGASVGAMVATLAAIGFTSLELQEFLDQDLRKIMVDHSCGYCSLLPNLLKGFGWNPGKKMNHWFGEQLKERTGDYDITFKEILQQFGKEICIVVTNLSHMSVEYFHPKTTPNIPVRKAVQMSMALPGVFQVVRETLNDQEDVYVDGGLLCNYPIHAFDGWWLSMHPSDTFFKRLQHLNDLPRLYEKSERFGTWNAKTLGIVLYSNTETELMKTLLSDRPGNKPPVPPDTKLSKQRLKMRRKQQQMKIEHEHMVQVVGRFMKELELNNLDQDSIIDKEEFRAMFENSINLQPNDLQVLFGQNCEFMDAFAQVDRDNDGEITFQELTVFLEKRGVNLQNRFLGYTRREIKNLTDFVQALQTALAVNVKRIYVEKRDVDRTVGIDTGYVESNDFKLELADKQFLIESGKRATRSFLCDYIKKRQQSADCNPVSSLGVTVRPEIKTTFDFAHRTMSSSSSTTGSYKSLPSVETV